MNGSPTCLTRYTILDGQISRLIAIDNNTFVDAGAYKSRYQYLLFDKNNRVLGYGVDIYNALDNSFKIHAKYLSNQGILVMHPEKRIFAYSVNFSSNIVFFEIEKNKIKLIESLRLGDPICGPVVQNVRGDTYHSVNRAS